MLESEKWTTFTPILRLIVMESQVVCWIKQYTSAVHSAVHAHKHACIVGFVRTQTLADCGIHLHTIMYMWNEYKLRTHRHIACPHTQTYVLKNGVLAIVFGENTFMLNLWPDTNPTDKTHIPSLYNPANLYPVSLFLIWLWSALNPFISIKNNLIEYLQVLDFIPEGFYCVNLNMIGCLEQMFAWSFLDVRLWSFLILLW